MLLQFCCLQQVLDISHRANLCLRIYLFLILWFADQMATYILPSLVLKHHQCTVHWEQKCSQPYSVFEAWNGWGAWLSLLSVSKTDEQELYLGFGHCAWARTYLEWAHQGSVWIHVVYNMYYVAWDPHQTAGIQHS